MRKAICKIIIMRKAKDHDWAGHLGRDYMGQETWPIVFGSPFNYPKGPTQPSPSSWSVSVVSASDSPAAAGIFLFFSLSHVGDLELLFFSPWNPLFQSAL
jgi:hypothetical protein